MGEVHNLTGRLLPGQVNDDLVRILEGLLQRAKDGDIVSMAWAPYSGHATDIIGAGWEGGGGTAFHLSAAISVLSQRYTQQILDSDE